jgi:hypothetical protein
MAFVPLGERPAFTLRYIYKSDVLHRSVVARARRASCKKSSRPQHFREIVWRRAHVWRRRGLGGLAVRQSYPGHPRKHSRRWPRRRYSVYLLYWYKITGTKLLNTDAPSAFGGGLVVGTQFRCFFCGSTKLQMLTQKALQAALRTLISTGHSIREI